MDARVYMLRLTSPCLKHQNHRGCHNTFGRTVPCRVPQLRPPFLLGSGRVAKTPVWKDSEQDRDHSAAEIVFIGGRIDARVAKTLNHIERQVGIHTPLVPRGGFGCSTLSCGSRG
jgi:hypothetical protein